MRYLAAEVGPWGGGLPMRLAAARQPSGGPGFRAWLYKITMPPHPWCFDGLDAIRPLLSQGLTEPGEWRLVPAL